MNDRSGDGTGSSEVDIKTNTAKFTNVIIARFRESRYLVRESEVFIKDKNKVASRFSARRTEDRRACRVEVNHGLDLEVRLENLVMTEACLSSNEKRVVLYKNRRELIGGLY